MPDPSQVIIKLPRFSRRKRPTAIVTPLMHALSDAGVPLTLEAKRAIKAMLVYHVKAAQMVKG